MSDQPSAIKSGFHSNQRADMVVPEDQSTTWTWNSISAGACTMNNATITLHSTGAANFSGEMTSPNYGDVWIVQGIALIDANGLELFRIAQFDGTPNYMPGSVDYLAATVFFPAYMYSYVSSLVMYPHC